ncbi:hypothetical protein FHS82_001577 [Pseudochelatococcus lubricantis]|uniref:Uncharacterized protein n=1 Tax=Pseudochelatococcus lubricantis TaxID=1538102 RepID=A0ABX0V3U9_9HYPH|nr:hypothetical protein [Pseudochelatococcus lubricantis]
MTFSRIVISLLSVCPRAAVYGTGARFSGPCAGDRRIKGVLELDGAARATQVAGIVLKDHAEGMRARTSRLRAEHQNREWLTYALE